MSPAPINGLVLAGGKSSRMGRDKSLLKIHAQPQRQHLFNLLSGFCVEVYLSCKDATDIPAELHPIADQFQIDSPLNGILSAFTRHPDAAWLAVAVDMPLVDAAAIDFLIKNRRHDKAATCFLDSDDRKPEPLLTLWEPRAFPLLMTFYKQGNISPRQFLMENNINLLTASDKKVLSNVNSEEELRKLHTSTREHVNPSAPSNTRE